MAGGPTPKIRLVRCPKCFDILPEPPDVPVYACGRCGTRLQAKARESDAGNTVPNSGKENAAQMNKLFHVSNDKVHGSPTLYSSEECSLDQSGGSDLITSGSYNTVGLSKFYKRVNQMLCCMAFFKQVLSESKTEDLSVCQSNKNRV